MMKRIAIVEDEMKMRKLLKMILEESDFEVETTESAEEFLDKGFIHNCDALITDLRLGGMSGLDLLRTAKTKGSGSRVACLTMVFKLAQSAERHWRSLNGRQLLPEVIQGTRFIDGIKDQAA